MSRRKVGIIGAGNVGATAAQCLVNKDLCDVYLYDIVEGLPQGKALDLRESNNIDVHDSKCFGTNNLRELNGCEIVVITAGFPRQPGMSREDLLKKNADIVKGCVDMIKNFSPQPIIVTVTNPLDVMTYLTYKSSGFPRTKVIGMAGILDSSRMAYFVSEKLQVSQKDIKAMVLGSHGDTMVALPRFTTISGIPITNLMSNEDIRWVCQRTRDGGAEIVALLKKGSAYYAPGDSTAMMVEAILKNERRILPCCACLSGEYGLKDIAIGVPVILGQNGIEKIIELQLDDDEKQALMKSATIIKDNINALATLVKF